MWGNGYDYLIPPETVPEVILGTETTCGLLFWRIWGKSSSVAALWGGNVDGAPEVLFLPCLDVVGLEAAYGDVDLRINLLALSVLVWITKNVFRKEFFLKLWTCIEFINNTWNYTVIDKCIINNTKENSDDY